MIKKEFGVQDTNNGLIKKEEDRLTKIIKHKIDRFRLSNEKDTVKNPLNTFNPLTQHLYFKTTFVYLKTFISIYKFILDNYNNRLLNMTTMSEGENSFADLDKRIDIKKPTIPPSHKEGISEGSKSERLASKSGFTLLGQEEDEYSEKSESNDYENDKLIMRDNR
jgi:hypothetical protein